MPSTRTIPFARPWVTDQDRQAVLEVLEGDILTHGPQNHAFEEEFSHFLGEGAHCAAVSSCMAALHLAYLQLGIGPGDEVIVPAQTHVATAHAVEVVGARPIFVDCEPASGNIDPERLEALITPRTRAIGLVHFVGIPCEMDAVVAAASRHGLKIVEDCALAVGSRYHGKHVGLIGDVGCFSFYPVKHLTTGDGGMLVTRHAELAERVRKARAFGVDRTFAERSIPGMYDVPSLGVNYRMSDINAALGRSQLRRVGEILERRQRNFLRLREGLRGLDHVRILDATDAAARNSHYCLTAVLGGPLLGRRNEVVGLSKEAGIGTSVYYPQPVPRMAYYRKKYGYLPEAYPEATMISDQSIALPVGPHLAEDEVRYIATGFHQIINEVLSWTSR
jgi:dTDP-4-amino-4,6-dideoxygalactose transaminase